MASANVVEIIIKAVDKYSKGFKSAKQDLQNLGKVGAAIAGGFVLEYKALESFGKTARELGFEKTAKQVDYMTTSLKDVEVALLKMNVGGLQLNEWLGQAASNAGIFIRAIGIGVAKAVEVLTVDFYGLKFAMAQVIPGMEGYTYELFKADVAAASLNFQLTTADIATVGLADSMKTGARTAATLTAATRKQGETVADLIAKNKKLRDSYTEIEDAIRAGDARALAAARANRGGFKPENVQMRSGGTGASMNKGDTVVNVIMDGQVIAQQTRKTIAEDLFKPVIKQSGTAKR